MQDLWKPTPPDKWTLPSKAQHELFAPESSRVTHLPPLVHVEKKPKAQGAARTTPVKRSRVVPSSSFGQTGDSPGQVRSTVIRPQAAVSTEAASSTAVTASAVVDNVGDCTDNSPDARRAAYPQPPRRPKDKPKSDFDVMKMVKKIQTDPDFEFSYVIPAVDKTALDYSPYNLK